MHRIFWNMLVGRHFPRAGSFTLLRSEEMLNAQLKARQLFTFELNGGGSRRNNPTSPLPVHSVAVPPPRAPSAGGGQRARPHRPAGKRRPPSTQPPQASASRSRSAPPASSASGTRKPRRSGAGAERGPAAACCNILPPQGKESQPYPKTLGFPAAL